MSSRLVDANMKGRRENKLRILVRILVRTTNTERNPGGYAGLFPEHFCI